MNGVGADEPPTPGPNGCWDIEVVSPPNKEGVVAARFPPISDAGDVAPRGGALADGVLPKSDVGCDDTPKSDDPKVNGAEVLAFIAGAF